jgi:cache 3/cache 2 fusion protein
MFETRAARLHHAARRRSAGVGARGARSSRQCRWSDSSGPHRLTISVAALIASSMTSVIKHAVSLNQEDDTMNRKSFFVSTLAASCFIALVMLMPTAASAQADPKVVKAMQLLKAKTAELGKPKIEGKEALEGKDVPALYFGTAKMNNNFTVVDEVVAEAGGTATLFVKAGDDYVRVSTNVPKPDGSGRAIGTVLDPTGRAIVAIRQGQTFYGEVPILGTPYVTGYEPIKDGSGNVVGIYYVGYKK